MRSPGRRGGRPERVRSRAVNGGTARLTTTSTTTRATVVTTSTIDIALLHRATASLAGANATSVARVRPGATAGGRPGSPIVTATLPAPRDYPWKAWGIGRSATLTSRRSDRAAEAPARDQAARALAAGRRAAIPEQPGVYRFRDAGGRVIYVGKAKILRSRLNSYFTGDLHPRTEQMVRTARAVDWTVVSTEVEALQLEYTWIKQFDPRFNVKYRDDKSYPWLAVTLDEEVPRLQVMRGPKRKGVRYFGPYSHAWAIRETLDLLLRVFPARTCSKGVYKRAQQVGRPCLFGYIDKCSAPCVGRVTVEEHREIVDDFCDFLAGQTGRFLRRLEAQMREASDALEYERAARLRDDIGALRRAIEKQAVVLSDDTDADAVAFAQDELEAAVFVFHVRGGRVRGQRGYVVDKLEGESCPSSSSVSSRRPIWSTATRCRARCWCPAAPEDADVVAELLYACSAAAGSRCGCRSAATSARCWRRFERNAAHSFTQHKLRRASDLTARSRALSELQDALGLADAPLRIECFDISNLQDTNVVASMVVFEDGIARKSEYRRFAIRGTGGSTPMRSRRRGPVIGGGDVDWIHEVVRRRFARYLDETAATPAGSGRTATVAAADPRPSCRLRASSPTRPTSSWWTAVSRR